MKFKTMQEWFSDPSRWLRDGTSFFPKDSLYKGKDEVEKACLFGAAELIYGIENYSIVRDRILQHLFYKGVVGSHFEWNDKVATIEEIQTLCKELEL